MSDGKSRAAALHEIFEACQHFLEAIAAYQKAIGGARYSRNMRIDPGVEAAWGRVNRYGMQIIRMMQAWGLVPDDTSIALDDPAGDLKRAELVDARHLNGQRVQAVKIRGEWICIEQSGDLTKLEQVHLRLADGKVIMANGKDVRNYSFEGKYLYDLLFNCDRYCMDPDDLSSALWEVEDTQHVVSAELAAEPWSMPDCRLKDDMGIANAECAPTLNVIDTHTEPADLGSGVGPPAEQTEAATPAVAVPRHSTDFTFVNWYGTEYTFALGVQSSAVGVLWAEWEKSGLGLHQDTIRNAIDAERDSFRMDTAFRKNPAFGAMIQRCGDGKYKLAPPNIHPPAPKTKGKKSAGITSKSRRKRL